jgi:hypothetical protein
LLCMPRTLLALLATAFAVAVAPATASADLIPPTANPPNVNFGTLPVGAQSAPVPVTLTETCTSLSCITMIIPDTFAPVISAATGFTQTNNCPVSLVAILAVPSTCVVNVSFVPNAVGPITGLLNTGPGGPTVSLNGSGSAPPSSSGQQTATRKKCKKKHHRSLASSAKKKCKKKK